MGAAISKSAAEGGMGIGTRCATREAIETRSAGKSSSRASASASVNQHHRNAYKTVSKIGNSSRCKTSSPSGGENAAVSMIERRMK